MKNPAGSPRPLALVTEGLKATRSQPVPSIVSGLVIALICAIVCITVGRSDAAERQVLQTIDAATSRMILVSDNTGSAEIRSTSIPAIQSLQNVEWVIGVGAVSEMFNAAYPNPDPAAVVSHRNAYGDVTQAFELAEGRVPQVGESIIGTTGLTSAGFTEPAGVLRTNTKSATPKTAQIVGSYVPQKELQFLDGTAFTVAEETAENAETLRFVYVMATDARAVTQLARDLEHALHTSSQTGVKIAEPAALTSLRQAVSGEMRQGAQTTLLLTMGIGLGLVTTTMFGATANRRRDFGRSRALGASKSAVMVLVLIQALASGILGAIIGLSAGLIYTYQTTQAIPSISFTASIGVLALITAATGSLPPALVAANADPVRIVRVP